jgi:serine/threonine protein kinase
MATLMYDPDDRISSKELLKHPFFKEVYEEERSVKEKLQQISASKEKLHKSKEVILFEYILLFFHKKINKSSH